MSQPVNLSNDAYNRLTYFKKRRKHKSYSNAVTELLNTYWSPQQAIIQVEEELQRFKSWLQSRELYGDLVGHDIEKMRAHIIMALKDKKSKNISDEELYR